MVMQGDGFSKEAQVDSESRRFALVARATIAIGTIVALVASVGAPFKWY